MKNAFGGLLNRRRHWTHSVIHETLVDLLTIQKEIHPGLFAVMDGTFAGDGPGPRAMRWHTPGLLLASADQVAIDAVASKLMGFDPMSLAFIRLAHERGLGCGDPRGIEVVGEGGEARLGFRSTGNTFASRGQKLIYWGPLKPLERLLLRSPIVRGHSSPRTCTTMATGGRWWGGVASARRWRPSGGGCSRVLGAGACRVSVALSYYQASKRNENPTGR